MDLPIETEQDGHPVLEVLALNVLLGVLDPLIARGSLAGNPANRIDFVIVHAFSRFFRNVTQYLHYKEQLKQAGVRLISATQDIPEGPHGELMETILAAFDGHQSEVNAGVVRDMMMANAEEGYWNGAARPSVIGPRSP